MSDYFGYLHIFESAVGLHRTNMFHHFNDLPYKNILLTLVIDVP